MHGQYVSANNASTPASSYAVRIGCRGYERCVAGWSPATCPYTNNLKVSRPPSNIDLYAWHYYAQATNGKYSMGNEGGSKKVHTMYTYFIPATFKTYQLCHARHLVHSNVSCATYVSCYTLVRAQQREQGLIFSFFFHHHFYFPAQLVGGFTLSDLLDKPWSQVSPPLPPGIDLYVPSFLSRIGFSIPTATNSRFSSNAANLRSPRAFRGSFFFIQEKVPTSMYTR